MLKKCIPNLKISDVYALDFVKLKEQGIRGIIFDVDNTLESHTIKEPSEKAVGLIREAQNQGFGVCIVSNGSSDRVKKFNKKINVEAIPNAYKPLKRGYQKALDALGTKASETAFVGDQVFTDIYGGNRMGLYTILVDPIEQIENNFFYVKRYFERFILNKIK